MRPEDLEALSDVLYEAAGEDPREPVPTPRIARKLLGQTALELVPRSGMRSAAQLARVHGDWRIYVRRGLDPATVAHAIGHELAHWALARHGLDDSEAAADYVGACLVVPRQALRRDCPDPLTGLRDAADRFVATESLIALRIGEVFDVPLALVSPQRVRVRGAWQWPVEDEIRKLVKRHREGVTKVRLTDDPKRIVIIGKDDASSA